MVSEEELNELENTEPQEEPLDISPVETEGIYRHVTRFFFRRRILPSCPLCQKRTFRRG